MQIREVDVREVTELREVIGLAVPYGQVIEIGGYREQFAKGAITDGTQAVLFYGHDHRTGGLPIGKLIESRSTDEGYLIRAKISDTPKGNEVYQLLKDGVLNKFSVGFEPIESEMWDDVVVRKKVTLKEVSIVPIPAYSMASVHSVREADNNTKEKENMDNDYSADLTEVRDGLAALERKFDRISEHEQTPAVAYRSAGEYLKALAKGESEARNLATRDFATSVEADNIRPAWINSSLKLLEKQRIVKGLFGQERLPDTGNSIEYPSVKTETGTVAEQVNEGDALAYMELAIDTATAPVRTYGGYSSLSRQTIERSDVAYLEAVLRFQTIQYANATEAAVQAALLGTSATANSVEFAAAGPGFTGGSASDWISAIIDAKAAIDDNSPLGLTADFILVSRDIQKKLSLIVDSAGRPVFAVNGDGQNTFGSLPLNGRLAGVIDGTPLVTGKNLPAGTVVVASSEALVTRESAGAPFRLQDESIVNLTKDFALYGYMAIAAPDTKGITFIVDGV